MFIISTRNFPPEVGGMQNLISGLASALVNHGPVKDFADKTEKYENSWEVFKGFGSQIKTMGSWKLKENKIQGSL